MNRRAFLSSLAAITAGATLDPERLLWRPGKLISIPRPHKTYHLMRNFDVNSKFLDDEVGLLSAEILRKYNVYEFSALPLPATGIARSTMVKNGVPVRVVAAYDVYAGYLGRVDCMFEGYAK